MQAVLNQVLKKATPDKKEKEVLDKFLNSVLKKIKSKGYETSVQGSLAKDTWVSGNHDVDVFVFFDQSINRETLEGEGLRIGETVIKELGGKPEIAYAEHPYVKSKIKQFNLDIVPCYKIKRAEHLKSAVDRTPFHTAYVTEHLGKGDKGQVRILKQFMKGIGVYSAKEKVRGFSGYLCEIFILKYGSFEKLINEAKKWEFGQVMDLEKYYGNEPELREKFKHCLIAVDPIDKGRNVAAALDPDNFEKFIYASQQFLKNPKLEFFFPNKVKPLAKKDLIKIMSKHGRFLLLKFKTPKLVEDILYSQLKKSLKSLIGHLELEGYKVLDSGILSNSQSYLLLEMEYIKLPKVQKLEGPPIKVDEKYQKEFTEKYKKQEPWVEDGRWYVEVPRKFTDVYSLLINLLKDPRKIGIGKYVTESMKKKYVLMQDQEILKEYKKEFAEFFTEYLTKKKPWEW